MATSRLAIKAWDIASSMPLSVSDDSSSQLKDSRLATKYEYVLCRDGTAWLILNNRTRWKSDGFTGVFTPLEGLLFLVFGLSDLLKSSSRFVEEILCTQNHMPQYSF